MRRTALFFPALVAGLVLTAACSSTSGSSSPSTSAAPSTTTPPATSGTTSGPVTTARSTATTSRSTATTGRGGSSASISTDGACGWLTVDEVEQATGQQVTGASVVRGGCRWSDGTTPVVDVEVDSSSDAASSFQAEKTIYADASVSLPDIGEDRYWAGLDDKLVFLDGGTAYTVWIQSIDDDSRIQPATIALAQSVEQHRS
ncbi:MAG: hypothetical protein U0Q07_06010 [Acidimicrobiales bacterium]